LEHGVVFDAHLVLFIRLERLFPRLLVANASIQVELEEDFERFEELRVLVVGVALILYHCAEEVLGHVQEKRPMRLNQDFSSLNLVFLTHAGYLSKNTGAKMRIMEHIKEGFFHLIGVSATQILVVSLENGTIVEVDHGD